ncbi:hypothetical protein ACHAWF_018580 [Thalassiosira exigua]
MRTCFLVPLVSVLFRAVPHPAIAAAAAEPTDDEAWKRGGRRPKGRALSATAESSPLVIPNAVNNATATIVYTSPVGDIPAKTWISFDDGPLVEVHDDLSLEAMEKAYEELAAKSKIKTTLLEPFSFESPYADPVCEFNGTIVKANVTGPLTLSCESPAIDNTRGAGVPFRVSSNGGHDVSSGGAFVYLSSQEREALVLEPNHGPSRGGTHVHVRGITHGPIANGPQALCKFGKYIFPAEEVGSDGEYLVCTAPPWSENDYAPSVTVSVSMPGQSNVFSGVEVMFRYDNEFSVSSLHPESGLVNGGTPVTIRGGPFQNPDEILCRFGDKVVKAHYHDVGEISCVSPNLGWIDEVQRVSVFTMAANPEIQTISANVEDYVNEIHVCHTSGDSDLADDDLNRGFRLVAPGGSIEYPLTRHTRWLHFNETADGFKEALSGLFPDGFSVNRTGPFQSQTFRWEIVLPKNETFDGETLRVVTAGGGAVKLRGMNAGVVCMLERRGTKRLGGEFRLAFSDNDGTVETTEPISHNATNHEIKVALEELRGIDKVEVNSDDLDSNMTGSGAFQWHVTFDSLKNAGDVPLLMADRASPGAVLLGTGATVNISETRKGASHAVFTIDVPSRASNFSLLLDGIEGRTLPAMASPHDVMDSLETLGGESIAVERYGAAYFFVDVLGYPLEGRLKAKFYMCEMDETPPSCNSELHDAILHAPATSTQLGGYFSLEYPSNKASCKACRHHTGPVSAFATANELESALQQLDLVDKVEVVITESKQFGEYKVPVESGIVGINRNFYIHFVQDRFSSSNLVETPFRSTSFSGDIPLLIVDQAHLEGSPTRDTAYSNDYVASVIEIVKGSDLNHGGTVDVAVSVNGGGDFSVHNPLFEYKPVPIVQNITPAHGSLVGGTAVRVAGDNFSRKSARFCLFSEIGVSAQGLAEVVPISTYASLETGVAGGSLFPSDTAVEEVICVTPAWPKPQYVHVTIVSSEGVSSLEGSLRGRGGMFRYHQQLDVLRIDPTSSTVNGSVSVEVFGGPFFSNEGIFCMFGEVAVPGTFRSPSQISCVTPPHSAGAYSLEVTQNGQDYTRIGHAFRFYHSCLVHRISPMSGPSRRAGTVVTVYGEDFVNATSLRCRFGTQVVPATFLRSSEIRCSSPPIESGALEYMQMTGYYAQEMKGRLLSFEVSNNGQDFTSSGQQFMYLEDIEAFNLSRTEGPSSGGTPVFLSGSNFVNSTHLKCRFGKKTTPAHYLTREAVLCFSPPVFGKNYINSIKEKSSPLLISNNAQDYVFFGDFTYATSLKGGTYQAGTEGEDTLLSCPRGSYCSGLMEKNFTLCDPGTYQPSPGQSSCIKCPRGYFCNDFGMSVPRICPPHHFCDEKGMDRAKPCPTNYICDRGTATLATACLKSFDFGTESCFDNSTDDFGLQASIFPAQVWAERHLMPLDEDAPTKPIRGRFCHDMSCLKFEDSDDFQVFDKSFDYSFTGFALRRPRCLDGTNCNPEVSPSSRLCTIGHFCRLGIKKPCMVGTYCPHDHVFDPIPCEPGSFNFMIGQEKCTPCPIGYYCPSYGLSDPVICLPGYVCSKKGLASPNIRCPAGFYCQNGTKTSDPFRNDTTLRPYACTPGTFCFAGTGFNEVKDGVVGYAQPCAAGFFCEAASTSPKGSGACPPAFQCPKGTANPRPTPKGFYAEHPGTIESTACLPGFYAPTIQTAQCYECPPGTSCMFEGLFEAEECGPGTYRSTSDELGHSCVPCPEGTWSKNWGLREKGECTRCATGVICELEGMTMPCSYTDLPTPYSPIVRDFNGMPAFEYEFPADSRPPPFSMDECLALNSDDDKSTETTYFFGELIPPYIDILGRGPHFRSSDQNSLKYQSVAKCYKNSQPQGSSVYRRMAEYHGPAFDIQMNRPHQGYGIALLNNQIFATAPPAGYDFRFEYFRGGGNGYISLPKARIYDPAFNCTKGMMLMNSSLVMDGAKRVVYTDPSHDYEGGYDVERCPQYSDELNCYMDEIRGQCCSVDRYEQRAIFLARDQFYRGTCEADLICSEGGMAPPQAKPCVPGFACDEATSLERAANHKCPGGFECAFATTPDTTVQAPGSQLKKLCEEGHFCGGGADRDLCPKDHFCPTGTSDPLTGSLANDGLLRMLVHSRTKALHNLVYRGGDSFSLLVDHEATCRAGDLPSLQHRFQPRIVDHTNVNYLEYFAAKDKWPIAMNEGDSLKEQCARDGKSAFIQDAMRRKDCSCHSQFLTLASVYRFWKCTSKKPLDDLSLGDVGLPPYGHGKRDFWYNNSRIHKDFESAIAMDPSMEAFGLRYGEGSVCSFHESHEVLSLSRGKLPDEIKLPRISPLPSQSSGYLDLGADEGLLVRLTNASMKHFENYSELKEQVEAEYASEREQATSGNRTGIDPFVFDFYNSIRLVEQFGQRPEEFFYLEATNKTSSTSIKLVMGHGNDTYLQEFDFGRSLDWCQCPNLLKCPNATTSGPGSKHPADCVSTKNEVLHRISLLPPVNNGTVQMPSTEEATVDESSRIYLEPFDVAILTINQTRLPSNMTYGEHYRMSIYDGCSPCPLRYHCSDSSCHYPPTSKQRDHLNQCLKEHRKSVCLRSDGSQGVLEECRTRTDDSSFIVFSEPDIEKCLSRPYFCSKASHNFLSFRRLCQDTLGDGSSSPIYDCSDVQKWKAYATWRNKVCCSQISELRGVSSCLDGAVCDQDSLEQVEEIIRDKLIGVFELKRGYIPPTEEPKGQLLMNASMQEEADHEHPLDLFNEWQEPFQESGDARKLSPHNKYKPELSKTWKERPGCCSCSRHPMPAFFESNARVSGFPDDKHRPIQVTISAIAKVELTVVVELLHGAFYFDFEEFFGRTETMLRVHSPGRFEDNSERATWLAVIERANFDKEKLDLPLNLPTHIATDGAKGAESRFYVDRPSNISIGDHRLVGDFEVEAAYEGGRQRALAHPTRDPIDTVREEDTWWPHEFLALPYLPFLSNCNGYDSHISLSRLLEEHPDCEGVDYGQTVPTKEHEVRGKGPVGDTCQGVLLKCHYEEEVREARKAFRWFEASSGTTLFQITRDAVAANDFLPSSSEEDWGRTFALDRLRDHDLIPITVDEEMGSHRHAMPRKIQLELKYFQVSKGKKRLVEAGLYFDDLCTTQQPEYFGGSLHILDMMRERGILPCHVDVNGAIKSQGYDLEIQYYPLGWFDLLNRFEFGGFVYFVFFTLMGIAIGSIGGVVYGINRLLTKLRHPPQFMASSLMRLVSGPQIEGAALAVIPYTVAVLSTYFLFSGILTFGEVHREWSETNGIVGEKARLANTIGRVGSALIVLGFYTIYRATQKLIPAAEAKKVGEEMTDDSGALAAKRAHFIWVGLSIEAILMCVWEFSYSDVFRNNIYRFKVLFQLCQVLMDLVVTQIMGDRLLAAPLLVSIQMAELLVTLGARNFVEFTLSFLVEISLSVVQRLFLYPLIKTVLTLYPRWMLLASQTFGRKGLTRQEKQDQESKWKKVNEDIQLRSEGVEPLLDSLSIYSVEKCGSILLPFMCFFLMLVYTETEMAYKYNINQPELLYYGMFALYMIPWMSLVDSFILSSQELLYGWRVYDYFSYQRWRFANRERSWNLRSHVDASVTPSLQNVDLLCFSSQHYFILSLIALGFGTNMYGVTICVRRRYNFLGDPIFALIVVVVISICESIARICAYISNITIDAIGWGGIWRVTQLQGTMDDVIASKLAIGEGRQEDLERERQELQAMNSESFRHEFIKKNRPWVLQHLVEIMTPRSLQDAGPDGRPLVDYVRDVYSKLMNVGEGVNRRADDRSDISSDEYSDDEEEKRRQWDRTPLEGSQLIIAQIWVQKARKRRVFAQAVASLIEKRKEDHCSSCSRTLGACSALTAGLAWNGHYDPYAIDSLIKQFEDYYSPEESNPNLWKAFFRENARFSTICNICSDEIEQHKLNKNLRHVGAGVPTRPGDISSDDESDDDGFFDPVIVARTSDEGQMMRKWLQAARGKLGGDFPTPAAVKQTEQYLDRLKHRKPAKEEVPIQESDSDWGAVDLDKKGEFIIKRWLGSAREGVLTKFDERSKGIRSELNGVLQSLDVESDWATGELRLEGNALKIEGDQISRQKNTSESQMERKLGLLRSDFDLFSAEIEEKRRSKKDELDNSLSQLETLSQSRKESRLLEVNKKIDELQEMCNNEVSPDAKVIYEEKIAQLKQGGGEIDSEAEQYQSTAQELNSQFADYSKVLDRELHSTLQVYERDCLMLREKTRQDYALQESDWQKNVNVWLGRAKRSLEAREREGGRDIISAKRARLEERRAQKLNEQLDMS